MKRRDVIFFLFLAIVFHFITINGISAQDNPADSLARVAPTDTTSSLLASSASDTLLTQSDSVTTPVPQGDIETTIKYFAKDSIVTSIDTKTIYLYGEAKVIYGDIELESETITVDHAAKTLYATGTIDSTGTRRGFPVFKNGNEVYETKEITYNFKTGRARISEVVTRQGEGFLHAEKVLKNKNNEVLSLDNSYTTCNLAEPHFRIRSTKTKAIPNDKIVSGPFNLEINNVPTPFGFPFGMFPAPRKSASGILIPNYGEESRRGFFLKDGGYFFDINDFVKLQVTGDIFSKGGYGIKINNNYNKRYSYRGSVAFNMTKTRLTDKVENPESVNDFRLTWNHSPQSKGAGRFSASVNAATATYTQNNFLGVNSDFNSNQLDNTTRKLNSSVTYSRTFKGTPFSMGMSARHNQDIKTKQVNLQLPDFYGSMRSVYPLKKVTKMQVLNKLNLRYNVNGTNKITNNLGRIGVDSRKDSIADFSMANLPYFFNDSRKGLRHTLPLSTSFKIFRFFNVSPSVNYEEKWYFEKLEWGYSNDSSSIVITDTIKGFTRISDYSTSASINTRIYGMYQFKKGNIQAIRHTINPSISFSMKPDFGEEKYGYYQKFLMANGREEYKSRYSGFAYGDIGRGVSKSIGFSLGNTLEMKVKAKQDSSSEASKEKFQKVSLLRSFGLSGSYNMAADSMKLSNISLRGNTSVLNNKLNVSFSGTLDPYTWLVDTMYYDSEKGVRVVKQNQRSIYAIKSGQGLGHISNARLNLSTNFNPKKRQKEAETKDKIQNSQLSEADKDFLLNNPDVYVDFDIPWSLRLSYNINYTRRGYEDPKITQTINGSGDVSLSAKWKVGFTSGYDFKNKDFTQTNITLHRDLHCWELNLSWTPFGRFTSYNFVIRVKSSLLSDLKINRKRSFFDR